jgi:hypothetical protein
MENFAILIQGVFEESISLSVIDRIKSLLPEVKVYYATYKSEGCFNELGINFIKITDPGPAIFKKSKGIDTNNSLRMIKTTLSALDGVSEEFVLKIRYDLIINNLDFLDYYFSNNILRNKDCSFKYKIGIVRYSDFRFHNHFYIDDFLQLGFRNDLMVLYQNALNLIQVNMKKYTAPTISPEKFLWAHCYSSNPQNILTENRFLFEQFTKNCLIPIINKNDIVLLKYPKEISRQGYSYNFKTRDYPKRYRFYIFIMVVKMVIRKFFYDKE